MTTVTKGQIGQEDIQWNDGSGDTFTRKSSTGRLLTLNKIPTVPVSKYGSLNSAVEKIGSNSATLRIDTPTTLTSDLTVPSNIVIEVIHGSSISGAYTLTLNGEFIGSADCFGSDLTVRFGYGRVVNAEWWGAVGDGATDDSVPIQAAIDTFEAAKSGTVKFLAKTYVGNIEVKSYVTIEGASPTFAVSSGITNLKANATGPVITTAATAVNDITVRNIGFIGLGSGVACQGLYLQDVHRSLFEDCSFNNFSDEAIRINDGNPNHFRRLFAQNCLLDRSQSAKIGVLHIEQGSDDNWIEDCEFTASSSVEGAISDANAYICAVVIDSAHNMLSGVVGEISDVGFHFTANGDNNRTVNCRGDLNYGNGWEILGGTNQFTNCSSYRNGRETDNTYDGWHSESAQHNMFSNCHSVSLAADAYAHRYGFYDDLNSASGRSIYYGCRSIDSGTADFSANAFYGVGPLTVDENMVPFVADDATPSVEKFKFFNVSAATGALVITDFDDGTPGQLIFVMDTSVNGYVTLDHGTPIKMLSGQDTLMLQNRIYAFKQFNSVWYEIGDQQFETDVTAASSGTDGTISSRSANPLSEADGFVKMYKNDGTAIYLPYWLDIAP